MFFFLKKSCEYGVISDSEDIPINTNIIAGLEKKSGDSEEIMVIGWEEFLRISRAVVIPAIPLPIIKVCMDTRQNFLEFHKVLPKDRI